MIILKHLTIERFRLLRSLNLHFPQRGSILIQGPNEAGKSALIESIFFALYGDSLAASRNRRSLDDLILYGAASAHVTLSLSIGATELSIARSIMRGAGQQVSLQVRRLGMPDEPPITDLADANQRIVSELGRMNGETLRNAGLVEQKGLTRLETISGAERESTVRRLLGLEKLSELTEQFQVAPEDEALLASSAEHLRLAEIQARIPQLSAQLNEFEAALDAVAVCSSLAEIDQQVVEIDERELALEQIGTRRLELKSRQGRVAQLKRADATLSDIIAAYDDIAEARRRLPELDDEIAELERREREEFPKFEKRVADLAELTRSFGTLERMSLDLLDATNLIKEFELELRQHDELKQDLKVLDEQVAHARSRLTTAQEALQSLEERRRTARPQLEGRLQRLRVVADSLAQLRKLEEQYTRRVVGQTLAGENLAQQQKVLSDLRDTEQELALVEREARQVQQRADAVEKTWRQLSIRRQLEEWHRLKGLALGLAQAEQHLDVARQHQAELTQARMTNKSARIRYVMIVGSCAVAALIFLLLAVWIMPALAIVFFVLMLAAAGAGGYFYISGYRKALVEEQTNALREQEAVSRVGMMVAARSAATRMSGDMNALYQVENDIRSLGGNIPRSLDEAQSFLDQTKDQGDLGEVQQQMKEQLEAANAARNQVNVTMEAVAALRKERSLLEELRRRERWDSLEEDLYNDQAAIERMQQEVTLLAGQESLPMPSINARLQASPIAAASPFSSGAMYPVTSIEDLAGVPALEGLVESTVKSTEREIATLDGKLDMAGDLILQAKVHQEALDVLVQRQKNTEAREAQYAANRPDAQLERAREQQLALRSALQSLQDSLRQRVKPLGVRYGQAAIGNAETVARRQLEELNITLGNKIMLQEEHARFSTVLKDQQESLAEHYKQLAKFSNALGSWIVPLNPFAEALVNLRTRCQRELEEADEPGILQELVSLQNQEGASQAKIALCQQEISEAQAAISALLTRRSRPQPEAYDRATLNAVWPLLSGYKLEDLADLEAQRTATEVELHNLEQQELDMSVQLGTQNEILDLEEMRARVEQQERSYQTRKRGNLLVKAVDERLLRKLLPRAEHYMQQILPLLTGGRYHDVHLVTEPEAGSTSGGPCQIQVWDSAAGEYLPSSALSGGAADQLSLALRLAFAIATLPRELSAAPGFVVLDEPLSSFDRGRAQALVDVVTGDVLSQHFEQIILISHSSAFDPAMFPYHVYMDNGLVVDSNLPVVPSLSAPAMPAIAETPLPIPLDEPVPAVIGEH